MESQAGEGVWGSVKSSAHIKRNCSQETPQTWCQILDCDSTDLGGNIVANEIHTHVLSYGVLTVFSHCIIGASFTSVDQRHVTESFEGGLPARLSLANKPQIPGLS